ELDEAAHLFDFFFLDPVERVEAAHLAGDPGIMGGGVEERDGANAALSRLDARPDGVRADAASAQQSHTGDDDSSVQCPYSPWRAAETCRGLFLGCVFLDVF